jgi:glycosyltransferase involved in cell wall biosynthesis
MSQKPDIAAMMLVYNGGKYLRGALDSLAAQTYKNFHLLIIDDCSPDDSWAIAQEYKNVFPHLTLMRNEPNKGAVKNLHDTLQLIEKEASSAEFFIWVCSDDWWSPDFMEVTRDTLKKNPDASICQTWFEKHDKASGYLETHRLPSVKGKTYSDAKKIFYPYKSDGKNGYYNQSIHGLIRMNILREIYPDDLKAITYVSCTELSILITAFLRGNILYHQQVLFHKNIEQKFTDKYPGDPLAKFYESPYRRFKACLAHLPRLLRNRGRVPVMSVLLLWGHLLYFYAILGFALQIKRKICKK